MRDSDIAKHEHCQMAVRYKPMKTPELFRPALFCKTHNKYLDWLTKSLAEELIDSGDVVEQPWDNNHKKKSPDSPDFVKKKRSLNRQRKRAKKFGKVAQEYKSTTGRELPN